MMKANELRIGNCLYSGITKQNFKVTSDGIKSIESGHDDGLCDGIPLTPGTLGKAGFVNGKLNNFYFFKNGNLIIEGYEADYNGLFIGGIKFLHSLQNLYHALTGEELNVEL